MNLQQIYTGRHLLIELHAISKTIVFGLAFLKNSAAVSFFLSPDGSSYRDPLLKACQERNRKLLNFISGHLSFKENTQTTNFYEQKYFETKLKAHLLVRMFPELAL